MPRKKKKLDDRLRFTWEKYGSPSGPPEYHISFGNDASSFRVGEPLTYPGFSVIFPWLREAEPGINEVVREVTSCDS